MVGPDARSGLYTSVSVSRIIVLSLDSCTINTHVMSYLFGPVPTYHRRPQIFDKVCTC